MALLSFMEIVDIVVMTLVVGYLFKDIFKKPEKRLDPNNLTMKRSGDGSYELEHGVPFVDMGSYLASKHWYDDILYAILLTAPAIILHEFGHKFVAMAYGMNATFHAAYGGLVFGIFLKWFLGFIAFVPAYVSITGITSPLTHSIVAFAGPAVNLLLWQLSAFAMKKNMFRGHEHALYLTKQINKILFILNMLPIPFFDGYQVYSGLWRHLF